MSGYRTWSPPFAFTRPARVLQCSIVKCAIKRVYDPPSDDDGLRVLVDRLWPRGLTKAAARVDLWLKEIAPSDGLRKWYAHDSVKWTEFQRRYRAELSRAPDALAELRSLMRRGRVTLLFSSRELEHNNAVALQRLLTMAPRSATSGVAPRRSHS